MSKRPLILTALFLSLLALAAPATALGAERTVAVEATATIEVPNDSASFGFGVTLTRGSRGAALQAASAKLQKVIAAVQGFPGVGTGDVQTGRVSASKAGPGRFRASEGISVTLHEPSKAGELTQAAIAAGATGVRGPSYFVGDKEAAYGQALAAAFQKAKAKGATLAAQAGASLGPALTITEGGNAEIVPFEEAAPESGSAKSCGAGSQPAQTAQPQTAKRAQSAPCAPAPPTKPGSSTVTATVGVVFALQ
ncbi:MAG TPA: SIMPL domain-containing protein [Solirubrobacterales bacterium]|jgi:hypothetical protein